MAVRQDSYHVSSAVMLEEVALNHRMTIGVAVTFLGVPVVTMTMTMTMTMTHSEKSHIGQMRAWPYRQECRGHGPTKKNLSYR